MSGEGEEEEGTDFLFMQGMYGWVCMSCGQARMGYESQEQCKAGATLHATRRHAPPLDWDGSGFRVMEGQWDE